jgi:hypothetical protein
VGIASHPTKILIPRFAYSRAFNSGHTGGKGDDACSVETWFVETWFVAVREKGFEGEARHVIIFYPKFHRELNYRVLLKRYTRENRKYLSLYS